MKAVILVGGPGTRLQPLTDTLPKSMVPVVNLTVMEHTFAYLKKHGINDVILTLNYLPDAFREYFGDGRKYGVNLVYCLEEQPLGTAGAILNAREYIDNEPFVVLNGDIFTDLDIGEMLDFHRRQNAWATIALHWVEDPSAFGVVEMDGSGRVQAFIEKPPREEATTNWINAGTYIVQPEVLDSVPSGQHYMVERGLFPDLVQKKKNVFGFSHRGYWLDMGTLAKYHSLNMDIIMGTFQPPSIPGTNSDDNHNITMDPTARIHGPVVIGVDCSIGPNVTVHGPSVIGNNCRIESGTHLSRAVLWDDVTVGKGVTGESCIVSSGTVIADNSNISQKVMTPGRTVNL